MAGVARQRKKTDRLFESPRRRQLGPREEEANQIICSRPGITVAQLAEEMDVTLGRVCQIVNRLEHYDRVVRQNSSEPPPVRG